MSDATVYVVDDDPGLNTSLAALFQSVGIKTEVFQDPEAFMAQPTINRPGCVVLDARMPGICGLDVLEQIRNRRWSIPILMISGHADVAMAVRALQAGATDFLEKPVNDTLLLQLVQKSINRDVRAVHNEHRCLAVRQKIAILTERERAVLKCVMAGMSNKATAREMGLSVKAVEGHRANLLHKMECPSAVELVLAVGTCPRRVYCPLTAPSKGGCDCMHA